MLYYYLAEKNEIILRAKQLRSHGPDGSMKALLLYMLWHTHNLPKQHCCRSETGMRRDITQSTLSFNSFTNHVRSLPPQAVTHCTTTTFGSLGLGCSTLSIDLEVQQLVRAYTEQLVGMLIHSYSCCSTSWYTVVTYLPLCYIHLTVKEFFCHLLTNHYVHTSTCERQFFCMYVYLFIYFFLNSKVAWRMKT